MSKSKDLEMSKVWGHFLNPATEVQFQSQELARNMAFGRWALLLTIAVVGAQGLGGIRVLINADAIPSDTILFLCIRLLSMAVLLGVWSWLPHITEHASWEQSSIALLLAISALFYWHQSRSPDQMASLFYVRVVLFTLFIYLFLTARLQWVLPLGLALSFAVFWGVRDKALNDGQDLPIGPSLLLLLVVNLVGAWIHHNRQQNARLAFMTRRLLTQRLEQEITLVQRQQDFIGVLAHEIRNPLAIIQTTCQLLNLQIQNKLALATTASEDILAMVNRIQSLIDQLMSNEKRITHAAEPQMQTLDAHAWLQQSIDLGQWHIERAVILKPLNTSARIWSDPDLLDLILKNLCSNAEKFSPSDSALVVSVRVRTQEVGIRVRDYGPGIAKKWHEFIFEKYARQTDHEGLAGYGFGLYLAKSMALQMNGRIALQSLVGKGSAFTIWLPRNTAT